MAAQCGQRNVDVVKTQSRIVLPAAASPAACLARIVVSLNSFTAWAAMNPMSAEISPTPNGASG